MPLSKNLNTYSDIAQLLPRLTAAGGGTLTFADRKEAKRWQQRAYYYRKLMAEQEAERIGSPAGILPPTPFDTMIISCVGSQLNIAFTTGEPIKVTTLDGKEIDHAPDNSRNDSRTDADDDLAAELEALIARKAAD